MSILINHIHVSHRWFTRKKKALVKGDFVRCDEVYTVISLSFKKSIWVRLDCWPLRYGVMFFGAFSFFFFWRRGSDNLWMTWIAILPGLPAETRRAKQNGRETQSSKRSTCVRQTQREGHSTTVHWEYEIITWLNCVLKRFYDVNPVRRNENDQIKWRWPRRV